MEADGVRRQVVAGAKGDLQVSVIDLKAAGGEPAGSFDALGIVEWALLDLITKGKLNKDDLLSALDAGRSEHPGVRRELAVLVNSLAAAQSPSF